MKKVVIVLIAFLLNACVSISYQETHDQKSEMPHNNFNSALWVQSASEYKANSVQAYNIATRNLGSAIALNRISASLEQTHGFENLPTAVVLDVDETVLDNSQYQVKLIKTQSGFTNEGWDEWVGLKSATAIPGAVDFIRSARNKGVKVIFITNRSCDKRPDSSLLCPQKIDTIDNLASVGIADVSPEDILLKKERTDWGSEKNSRRAIIAEKYRIIMLFGDDLGDFLPHVKKNITPQQRDQLVSDNKEKWGVQWYMLANPAYGS